MKSRTLMVGLFGLALSGGAPAVAGVGKPVAVAPRAEGTRSQTWASVAWCEGAKSWLVAWREGFLNEPESSIWCARVSADGKALDLTGIRLTAGKGLKDRPRVASDGRRFLVVWEDMRNGKDWDVYAARVSGDGKAMDENGFLISGGEHNQCRPDAAFAKGNYFVVWMGYAKGYGVYGARVSSTGKIRDSKAKGIAVFNQAINLQAITPVIASRGDELLVAMLEVGKKFARGALVVKAIDAGQGGAAPGTTGNSKGVADARGSGIRTPALALGDKEALAVIPTQKKKQALSLLRLDRTGNAAGDPQSLGARARGALIVPRPALAGLGDGYLLVSDRAVGSRKGRETVYRYEVRGWRVSAAGKPLEDTKKGFEIAGTPERDAILPSAASGPKEAALVIYSEVRGVNDVKVMARVVRR